MSHFPLVYLGLDTGPMLAELEAAADLWDLYPVRRTTPGSPHAGMTDIWLRTRAREDLAHPDAFRLPFWPTFYPAWHRLPSLHRVVHSLMATTKAVQLGQVLLTKIPPGGVILPHIDRGWSVDWFQTKFYVVLAGNEACVNICEDERVTMPTGSIYQFENRRMHSVENHGETDRVSLIVTVRVEA